MAIFSVEYKEIENNKFFKRKIIKIFGIKINKKVKTAPVLCLVDAGGIGDYVFCRPYFKYIKQSPKYKNYNIIYVGKIFYDDFVRAYDDEVFDAIIEYNEEYYYRNKKYLKQLLKKINKYKIDDLINLRTITIGQNNDFLVRHNIVNGIEAKNKFVSAVDLHPDRYNKKGQLKIYDNILLTTPKDFCFETIFRRNMFQDLLKIDIPVETDKLEKLFDFKKNHILISLMANDAWKKLSNKQWKGIIDHIIDNISEDTELLFLGIAREKERIQKVLDELKDPTKCINLAGKISSAFLPTLLANSQFLLAVETGTVHLAHSVGCKAICLSNGSWYGKFLPYDDDLIKYIYPQNFKKLIDSNSNSISDFYGPNQTFSVEEIDVNDVIEAVDELMEIERV